MSISPHQAKYFAHELTKINPSDSIDKLATTLTDAQVELNPHQIDAALFAFRSPLSKGAILADEVGLGKTIEAGILISQKWAERKRKLLVIVPATLRKQWSQELADKFFLPSIILEKKTFDFQIKNGYLNPFDQASVVICSYQFVKSKDVYVKQVAWDLVVVDEAHRLRNVYKPTNKVANAIKSAIAHAPKVLLTATPLQNSLLELYGLVGVIDDQTFGDIKSFRDQYIGNKDDDEFEILKNRLKTVCQRTLRRQVLEYINYTNRIPITQEFYPSEGEQRLYDLVSDYLQREKLYALPKGQRKLMTLILRKLLASSTYAISGTLTSLSTRLEELEKSQIALNQPVNMELVSQNLETAEEIEDEWLKDDEDEGESDSEAEKNEIKKLTPEELSELKHEQNLLKEFLTLSQSITKNSKGEVLLKALEKGFEKLKELGAARKAVIFTESTRTQLYLLQILEQSGYQGKVVLFNGSNTDAKSKEIYASWLSKYQGTDKVTGSKTSDLRAALVEYFKNEAVILIATEAAAEGINLQFCSLVVNYDLPWNPQRIEQRIGRCHRYGQKYDVVVVNFLNKANAADQRVYELLEQKFKLFEGVFGASDEVLGSLESGLDFERRIVEIIQKCRNPEQIEFEFNQLQTELDDNIQQRLTDTKRKLLENFDEEVQEKLKIGKERAVEVKSRHEAWLWGLTKYFLEGYAEFGAEDNYFILNNNPFPDDSIHRGPYRIGKNIEDANIYRIGHPLAQKIIERVKNVESPFKKIVFDITKYPKKIHTVEQLKGQIGFVKLSKLTIDCYEKEEYLFFSGFDKDGCEIPSDVFCKMMSCGSDLADSTVGANDAAGIISTIQKQQQEKLVELSLKRNNKFFHDEREKLELWAEDNIKIAEKAIKDTKEQIKTLQRQARTESNIEEQKNIQEKIQKLEKQLRRQRQEIFVVEDEIIAKRDGLIGNLMSQLNQKINCEDIFTIQWEVI